MTHEKNSLRARRQWRVDVRPTNRTADYAPKTSQSAVSPISKSAGPRAKPASPKARAVHSAENPAPQRTGKPAPRLPNSTETQCRSAAVPAAHTVRTRRMRASSAGLKTPRMGNQKIARNEATTPPHCGPPRTVPQTSKSAVSHGFQPASCAFCQRSQD